MSQTKTNLKPCIYCASMVDISRGEGDHVIPSAIGQFKGDKRFRRICTSCNNLIGRSEQQLLGCGLESVLRYCVNVKDRRGKNKSFRKMHSVHGAKTPQTTIDRGDYRELINPDHSDRPNVYPVDQFVIQCDKGKEHFIQLYPGMSEEDIKTKINNIGIIPKTIRILCDDNLFDEYKKLAFVLIPEGLVRSYQ